MIEDLVRPLLAILDRPEKLLLLREIRSIKMCEVQCIYNWKVFISVWLTVPVLSSAGCWSRPLSWLSLTALSCPLSWKLTRSSKVALVHSSQLALRKRKFRNTDYQFNSILSLVRSPALRSPRSGTPRRHLITPIPGVSLRPLFLYPISLFWICLQAFFLIPEEIWVP